MRLEEIDHVIDIIRCYIFLITNGIELDADRMIEDGNVKGALHGWPFFMQGCISIFTRPFYIICR